jgi:hypothetical protein
MEATNVHGVNICSDIIQFQKLGQSGIPEIS